MPLESDQWEQKCRLSHPFNGKYELKCIHFIKQIIVIAWKPCKQLFLLRSVMTGTHILSKQNFLLLRPSWMPSWISQSAINYTNLCWHFQILQTVPNILAQNTSCKKKRFDSLKFWLHRVLLKMTIWEHKMTKILHILGYFPWKFLCVFFLRNHLHSLENLQKFDYIIVGIE